MNDRRWRDEPASPFQWYQEGVLAYADWYYSLSQRNRKTDLRAFSLFRLHIKMPVVLFDELSAQHQSKTRTFLFATGSSCWSSSGTIDNELQLFSIHTHPSINHSNQCSLLETLDLYGDYTFFRSVLAGIAQQVLEDGKDHVFITLHLQLFWAIDHKVVSLLLEIGFHYFQNLANDFIHVHFNRKERTEFPLVDRPLKDGFQ